MNNLQEQFNNANALLIQKKYDAATDAFLALEKIPAVAPLCYYQLAVIANATGDPEAACALYYKAFEAMPNIAAQLYGDKHTSRTYVYKGKKEEKEQVNCPFCKQEAKPRWCYPLPEASGYNEFFNPVRIWMYCEPCHHMFARHFPEKLFLHNANPRKANPACFPYYSQILSNIRARGFAQGMDLFEIGIGASECLLAAREIGYTVYGIDVIERHVEDAKNLYGLDAETADINEFKADKQWDVIIMGDVIEHVSDPEEAMRKVKALMKDDGAVWVSTPSFESAFSAVANHNDVMRRQQYHLNYFSRESFYAMLDRCGLVPVDYHISAHYNGSMEIVAIKK